MSQLYAVLATYKYFQDVNLVDKSGVVLHFLFLDGLNGELLMTLSVLSQINDSKTAIGQFLLEGIDLFDVSLGGVDEVLRLVLCA